MGIHKYDVYRSPNIGIFLKANDRFIFIPKGFAGSKTEKLEDFLGVKSVSISVARTRLLGPLMVANNNGILLPRIAEDDEVQDLKRMTGLNVAKLETRMTALGNLIATNDKAAIASPLLPQETLGEVRDVLGVSTTCMSVASYHQVGATITCTNNGAAVHPKASDGEINMIREALNTEVEPATANGGVPFVTAGVVANSRAAVVGSLTTGPELIMLSRAFRL